MAIIQISKIQQRSGNIVDLPQLDEAEFGWATDAKRLFIGKVSPNENIEVLTSYSNINFSQINGSVGNLDVTGSVANGQIMTYDGTNWTNRGGSVGGLINLGNVANVKIEGGAISYVLETDGTGNLSWTPKSTVVAYISNITKANPAVVTTTANNYFTNSALITITDVNGMTQVNGNSYYVDVLTSNTFALYTDVGLSVPVDSSGYGTYTSNGRAISAIGGSGAAAAGGSNTTIQFNNNNILDGDADFTWNYTTNLLNINGNANIGNLNANGIVTSTQFVSNVATGTAPLTVTSTTRVSNLNVAYSNVSDFNVVTAQTTGTFFPVLANGSATANRALAANANLSFNIATGNLSTTLLSVTSNANVGNLGTAGLVVATGNVTGGNLNTAGVLSVTGNANVGNLGTAGLVVATGNVTGGNLNTAGVLSVTGNANVGNLGTAGLITATGNVSGGNITTSGRLVSSIATGTAPLTVTSTTRVANLNVNYANVSDFEVVTTQTTGTFYPVFVNGNTTANYALASNANISVNAATGALAATLLTGTITTAAQPNITSLGTLSALTVTGNVSAGNVSGTLITGTLTTAAQPNVTSVGTLSSVTVSANVTTGGIKTDNYYYANGVAISFAGAYSNSNVASYLPTFTGTVGATALTTGANTTAGTITGNWALSAGSRLVATYADLAEYYTSDADYEPGTVVEFGGDAEVTLANDGTTSVAGVVSTNPAYAMNAKCEGDYVVALALQGRVPCKVRGTIRKGDIMVSGGNGFARPSSNPTVGSVIGKALENFSGVEGVIEVAVGRL